jgi:hypothetical protein
MSIKKYTDNIQTTIQSLGNITENVEINIKELITILNAVNKGMIKSENQIKKALNNVGSGKFETKSKLKDFLNDLEIASKESESIVNYWDSIKGLTVDEVKQTEEYSKLVVEVGDTLKDIDLIRDKQTKKIENQIKQEEIQIDLAGLLAKKYSEFSTVIQQNQTGLQNLNIDLTKGVNISKKFLEDSDSIIPNLFDPVKLNIDDLKGISKEFESIKSTLINPINSSISDGIDISSAMASLESQIESIKPQIEQEFALRSDLLETYVARSLGFQKDIQSSAIKNISTQEDLQGSLYDNASKSIKDQISLYTSLSEQLMNINIMSDSELKSLKDQIGLLNTEQRIILGQYSSWQQILKAHQSDISLTEKQLTAYNLLEKKLENYRSKTEQIGDSIQDVFNIVPYGMQRMLGIERIGNKISDSLADGMKTYIGNLALGQSKLQASGAAAKSFGSSFTKLLSPTALIIGAFAAVYSILSAVESKISDISKELGISRGMAKNLTVDMNSYLSSSANKLGTEEQVLEIQKAQVEKYGRLIDLTKQSNQEIITAATTMEASYGIAASSAYDIMSSFKNLGANDELAKDLMYDLGMVSEMAGISPSIISKDLLESSKELSLYFGGMPKKALQATIQINRMGMSLKTAGQIADKMLNIESFMSDMFELSSMTGGKIDLSKAFDLRMDGKLEESIASIMDSIGSLQDFNVMDEFTKKKLSNTLGMEVTEIQRSLKLKELSNKLTTEQYDLVKANIDQIGDLESLSADVALNKANELNSTKKLSVALNKIKMTLINAFLPIVESLADTLSSSTGIIDGIGAAFKVLGGIIKFISPIVQGFLYPFQLIGNAISSAVDWVEKLFGSNKDLNTEIQKTGQYASIVGDSFSTLAKIVGGFFGAKYIFTGLSKSLTPLQTLKDLAIKMFNGFNPFKSLEAAKINVDKPLKDLSAKVPIYQKIIDKFNPFKLLGKTNIETGTMPSVDLTKQVTNQIPSAETAIPKTDKINKFGQIFEKVVSIVKRGGEIIKDSLQYVSDIFTSLINTISKSIASLGTGIGSAFNSIISGIGTGLSKFQPNALIGSAAFIVLASALWITSKALNSFNTVNWESLAKAGIALTGLGIAAAAFGSFAPLIIVGSAAIAIASGAFWLFGKSLQSIVPIMDAVVPIIDSLMTGFATITTSLFAGISSVFETLSSINVSQLLLIGPALLGISAGLLAMSTAAGVNFISKIFGDDSFNKLKSIGELANPLTIVATAIGLISTNIKTLVEQIQSLNSIDIGAISKLKDIQIPNITTEESDLIKRKATTLQNNIIGTVSGSPQVDLSKGGYNIRNIIQPSRTNENPIKEESRYLSSENLENISNTESSTSNTYNREYQSSSNVNLSKIERRLDTLVEIMALALNRPATAVIGNSTLKDINSKFKGFNNR